jgi:Mrp family chromosome partitioning ATPase/capsular polysaccharide biosynthesis protein
MDLLAILRTVRRHWVLILALTVVGAGIGVATAALDSKTTKSRTFYKATTTLVVDLTNQSASGSPTTNGFQSLDQVAIYTTTGDVPDLVAKQLGTDESGRQLAEHVITTTNSGTSTIAITAAAPTADDARRTADTFAVELVANLDQRGQNAYAQARDRIQGRLDDITKQKNALFAQLIANPSNRDTIQAQYDALTNQYRITYDSYASLAAEGPPTSRFQTLQKAEPIPIDKGEYDARLSLGATARNNLTADNDSTSSSGSDIISTSSSSPVSGPVSRGVLGGVLGLLLGIALAVLLQRLDRRIRTRADAEGAFTLPVLADVPEISKAQQRDHEIVAATTPLSRVAEAYRAIRSSVLFSRAAMAAAEAGRNDASRNGTVARPGGSLFEPAHDEPLVVMITSASPNEGKTSTTANLAAVFAEAGSSVLVVNCDFRRPTIHRYFGIEDEPRRVHETGIAGVKVVTNVLTDPRSNPAQVVAAQRQVVASARGRFDVILLDTAPLLTANDAVELVSSADMVLLVARVGVSNVDAAERSIELLNRLDVPIAGVVLVGAIGASSDYYYYYQPGRIQQFSGAPAAGASAASNGNGLHGIDLDMFVPEPGPAASASSD